MSRKSVLDDTDGIYAEIQRLKREKEQAQRVEPPCDVEPQQDYGDMTGACG